MDGGCGDTMFDTGLEDTYHREAALLLYRGYDIRTETPIFHPFIEPKPTPEPGFITDFIGVRTRTSSIWDAARGYDGKVTPLPVPNDYHAETIEWLGLLRSAVCGRDRGAYRVLELGAGFGMWSVAGGVAARRIGTPDVKIYAVEGDPLLSSLMVQHFADNGFDPAQNGPIAGAVGVEDGMAQWPKFSGGPESATYNFRPILEGEDDYMQRGDQGTIDVKVYGINDLLEREERWDLVHSDIQGHEAVVFRAGIASLTKRVHRMVIGTHSRMVEAELFRDMREAGWLLENEKPCKFTYAVEGTFEAMTYLDGTQIWRNTRLD